jgi:hypothetical protein
MDYFPELCRAETDRAPSADGEPGVNCLAVPAVNS